MNFFPPAPKNKPLLGASIIKTNTNRRTTEACEEKTDTFCARPSYQIAVWKKCSTPNAAVPTRAIQFIGCRLVLSLRESRFFLAQMMTPHINSWWAIYAPHADAWETKLGSGLFQKYQAAPWSGYNATWFSWGWSRRMLAVASAAIMTAIDQALFNIELNYIRLY